jgi:hypothetical protein
MAVALKVAEAELDREELSLEKQMSNIQEEARMVLPGIQALFGFQLIAVFQEKFTSLSGTDKLVHMGATGLTLVAILLMIAPAAFHRIAEPDCVTKKLVLLSSRLVSAALLPLSMALSLDFYLFTHVVLGSVETGILFGSVAFVALLLVWFAWPGAHLYRKSK